MNSLPGAGGRSAKAALFFCTRASAGAKGRMTAARTGGAGVWPGVIRVTFWGAGHGDDHRRRALFGAVV